MCTMGRRLRTIVLKERIGYPFNLNSGLPVVVGQPFPLRKWGRMEIWYYIKAGRRFGPVTTAQLKELAATGAHEIHVGKH